MKFFFQLSEHTTVIPSAVKTHAGPKPLCNSESGYILLINEDGNTVPTISQASGSTTAFLPYASTYTFKCVQNHSRTPLKQNDLTLGNEIFLDLGIKIFLLLWL